MAPQQERAAFLPGPISFCILPPGSAQGISPKQTNKFLTPHILETLWPGTDFQLHSSISGACCSLGLCSSHLKIHRMFSSLQRNSLERTKVFIFARMEFLPLTAACSLCSVPDAPCTYPFLNSAPIPPLSHILALHAPPISLGPVSQQAGNVPGPMDKGRPNGPLLWAQPFSPNPISVIIHSLLGSPSPLDMEGVVH